MIRRTARPGSGQCFRKPLKIRPACFSLRDFQHFRACAICHADRAVQDPVDLANLDRLQVRIAGPPREEDSNRTRHALGQLVTLGRRPVPFASRGPCWRPTPCW